MSNKALDKTGNKADVESQKETFITSLSHDLKNPTIAQIRALELLLNGKFGFIGKNQREIISMLLDSCKYMNSMLCSLLTTYKTEKGTVTLTNEKISIYNLALECYDELKYLAQDKEINIQFENHTSNDIIWGDTVQLRRVIMNLLTNGIKYAYKKSPLFIRIYNNTKYVYFEFENNSPYIKPDKQTRIFAKYISYTNAHETFGIGLGLYTSQKITEAFGGKMYVKSFKDNRNIFGFKIPYGNETLKEPRKVVF